MNVHAHIEQVGARWLWVLCRYEAQPELIAEVNALTDAFFQKHPAVARTATAEAFIAALAMDSIIAVPKA